jgi:hypothetical protein
MGQRGTGSSSVPSRRRVLRRVGCWQREVEVKGKEEPSRRRGGGRGRRRQGSGWRRPSRGRLRLLASTTMRGRNSRKKRGEVPPWGSAIAGDAPATGRQGRRHGRTESGCGVKVVRVSAGWGYFIPPDPSGGPSDHHPTVRSVCRSAWQATGCHWAGPRSERHHLTTAQVGARAWWAVGRSSLRAKNSFLCYFLQNTVLLFFVQFFEQIAYSFLYSNYSNEKFV